ncbi:MAG TPA: hypothetical protein VLE89_03825 [Chlamydiales bacterium]|nr:hypothetical protein [Chlamydiales bacterium]
MTALPEVTASYPSLKIEVNKSPIASIEIRNWPKTSSVIQLIVTLDEKLDKRSSKLTESEFSKAMDHVIGIIQTKPFYRRTLEQMCFHGWGQNNNLFEVEYCCKPENRIEIGGYRKIGNLPEPKSNHFQARLDLDRTYLHDLKDHGFVHTIQASIHTLHKNGFITKEQLQRITGFIKENFFDKGELT